MKLTNRFRAHLAAATLAAALLQPGARAQAPTPLNAPAPAPGIPSAPPPKPAPIKTTPAEAKPVIPMLKLPGGPLTQALEELSSQLRGAKLPEMNVIVAPEARVVHAPELLLRNVTGPDALRLIAVSAGCDVEDIDGADGQTIGYRIFGSGAAWRAAHGHEGAHEAPAPASVTQFGLGSLPGVGRLFERPQPNPPAQAQPPLQATPILPTSDPLTGHASPYGTGGAAIPGMPGMSAPGGVNYSGEAPMGGMPGSAPFVEVYALETITNTVKFAEVEATLRDLLKAGGVSADAAKIAFHEKTNVLLVTGEHMVHVLVRQLLEAMQKNASAANEQNQREARVNRDAIQAEVRLRAEMDEKARLQKQLTEMMDELRAASRELDQLRAQAPKTP